MSQAVIDYVGKKEVLDLVSLVMTANHKKAVKDASINVYNDYISLTIENGECSTFLIDFKYDASRIKYIDDESDNFNEYIKLKELIESLIENNGGNDED